VDQALAAKDFERAARLAGQNGYAMLIRGELGTLKRWIEALPEEVLRLSPQVIIVKAWTLTLAGDVRQVEPLLQQVDAAVEAGADPTTSGELSGTAAAIRAFFAMMAGDYPRALALAERADSLLPEHSVHARWLVPYTLGAASLGQGQYAKAVEAFARQARMGEDYDDLIVWATGLTQVAIVSRLQGRLGRASETCRTALYRMAERGAEHFGSLAKVEVPLVEVLRERNELEEASRRVQGVIERMQGWPMPTDHIFACLALIRVQEAQGDFAGALDTLHRAQNLKASRPVLMNLARAVDLSEIRLDLTAGETAAAARKLDALQPGASRTVSTREAELLMLARLRQAQGRLDEAEAILAPLALDAEAGARFGALLEILVLRACVMDAKGDRVAALAVLTKALELAEPEGYLRIFLDEGDAMRKLLAALANRPGAGTSRDSAPGKAYIARILEAFGDRQPPERPQPAPGQAALVEPLTPREMEVLQLIAAGDSNQAIAEKLVITTSAVKKHAANIYGKLGVSSRTQAVASARKLRLIR
jgi:LuxR family maltose regulon positive regulatory protein